MFDIAASRKERECYYKWKRVMKSHCSRPVRQPYYQARKMDDWEREYALMQEEMRREMECLRAERFVEEEEQRKMEEEHRLVEAHRLAEEKDQLSIKRADMLKKRLEKKAAMSEERNKAVANPRRSGRLSNKSK
jgi:hypothetical protein